MTQETPGRLWRFLGIAVLAIATLGFGAMGLCGAAFTVMSLPGLFAGGIENYSGAALVIAVPSLLIGGAVAAWAGWMLWRLTRTAPPADDA
ncbi:hypothetical protein [Pelomonas cellulosilytica]|uniref:Major facilitator superfamily (MFS) profile domain-containing protein n=1 Tax=Pelomonas cellulosilytica TaxID=2906762 RepID=A0ABS8XWZ9_9BURK|nr:hypothetical protein [Pelomonas sp. P8]MCE4555783.1 hypothetical protein [Pelomonas sp. P8]